MELAKNLPPSIPTLKCKMKAIPVVGIATIAKNAIIVNRATGAFRAYCANGAKVANREN